MDKNYLKYLKYKNKYNQLKLQTGGGEDNDMAELKCIQLNLIKEVLQIRAADPMGECPASIERLIEIYKIANNINIRISNLLKYNIQQMPPQLTSLPQQLTPPPSQLTPPPFQSTPLEGCPSRAINTEELKPTNEEAKEALCSKKNYNKNALKLHPDKNPNCIEAAADKFKLLSTLCTEYKANNLKK